MLRVFLAVLLLLTLSPLVVAGPQDDRRIEDQKREKLKSTEIHHQQEAQEQKPAKTSAPLQPEDIVYLLEMSLRKVTYGYDLCKTLVILKGLENEYIGLDAQVNYLKENDLLPDNLKDNFDPMKPLRRGLAAFVLSRALDIKGGVFFRIFKNSERYAMKELAYEGIMSSGNVHEIISGDELSATITRAVNYLQK